MSNSWKEKKIAEVLPFVILLVLATVFLSAAASRFLVKTPKIFSADIDRIMGEHPAFQEAMLKFQAELQSMQEKLNKMEGAEKNAEQQKMQQQIQQLAVQLQEEAGNKVIEDVG